MQKGKLIALILFEIECQMSINFCENAKDGKNKEKLTKVRKKVDLLMMKRKYINTAEQFRYFLEFTHLDILPKQIMYV